MKSLANYIFHDNKKFFDSPILCGDYIVYQVGEMYCKRDTVLETHKQICYEITFAVDGEGSSGCEEIYVMRRNDCFFSIPEEQHIIKTNSENPLRFHFLGFNVIPNSNGEKYISTVENLIKTGNRVKNIPKIHNMIDDILSEVKQMDYLYYDRVGYFISEILIEIIRAYSPNIKKTYSKNEISESILISQIIEYIDDNILTLKNLGQIEKVFNYSYNYISVVFAKTMTFSLNDYYRKVKMEKAQEILKKEVSITEVSEMLGYSSIHTFSRAFKQYFGYTPSSFIKTL